MITITEKALNMMQKQGAGSDSYLRIQVKSGGCSGMTYDAEIDFSLRDEDTIVQQQNDITIVSTKESLEFLDGLKIDYSDDLISAGYRFNNSSNSSSCGCGASFSVSGFPQLAEEEVGCGS